MTPLKNIYISYQGYGFPKENGRSTVEFLYNEFFTVTYYRGVKNHDESGESSLKSSLKIIDCIKENPEITIPDLSGKIGIGERAIKKQIKILKDAGKIIRIGPDKGGHWEIIQKKDKSQSKL